MTQSLRQWLLHLLHLMKSWLKVPVQQAGAWGIRIFVTGLASEKASAAMGALVASAMRIRKSMPERAKVFARMNLAWWEWWDQKRQESMKIDAVMTKIQENFNRDFDEDGRCFFAPFPYLEPPLFW